MSHLPVAWCVQHLGELIELNPKNHADDSTTVGFVPMPKLGTAYRSLVEYEVRTWGEVKKGYTHFSDEDVLLAKITPCFENGKAGIPRGLPNGVGAGSTEYFVCRPNRQLLNNRYLLAWFKTEQFLRNGAVEMTGSVGHKRVPKDFVLKSQIPLAPLAEQKRIADKLDAVLARVDACRDRLDRIPTILKRFRQSVLAAATSGQLTADWRAQQSVGLADAVSPTADSVDSIALTGWVTLRADQVCEKVQSGGTPKAGFSESGVPFLKVYNIVNQQVDFDYKPQFVSKSVHSVELKKSIVQPGDVLMNIVGPPLGKVAVVPPSRPEWNINQAITLFRPSARILSGWIYVVLCEGAPVRDVLVDTKGSVGQVNISLSQCRAFGFPVPPLREQEEIVRRVETLFAFADRLEARVTAARESADRLTPALLAKAFRGELVPQDPNDEPAAELLKRLAASNNGEVKPKRGRKRA